MKKTAKRISLILAAILLLSMLSACGGDKPAAPESPKQAASDQPADAPKTPETPKADAPAEVKTMNVPDVPGVLVDAGNVQALAPEGWMAFPSKNFMTDEIDPNVLLIVKGGESDLDLMSKPMINISYYPPDEEFEGEGMKDYYGDAEDVQPMKCGANSYTGFTTAEFGDPAAVLWTKTNGNQYQVDVFLEVKGEAIALDDPDVLAILASVAPSDGTAVNIAQLSAQSGADAGAYAWWDGVWYGWWAIYNGNGVYEDASNKNMCWDAYAKIKVDGDKGTLVLWDSGTTEEKPLISCDALSFTTEGSEHGTMYAYPTVFPAGVWNLDWAADPATDYFGWDIDPEFSSVSHFENMIELSGYYESPENPRDSFSYSVFLKPWGEKWDDVKTGDTTDCLYKDMMPIHYDDWYLPLLELGYDAPPAYHEGEQIVEAGIPAGGSSEAPAAAGELAPGEPSSTGSGRLETLDELYTLTKWLNEMDYDYRMEKCTYDFVVDFIGVEGEDCGNKSGDHYFRWRYRDETQFIYVGFHDTGDGKWVRWNYNTNAFTYDDIPDSITVSYD